MPEKIRVATYGGNGGPELSDWTESSFQTPNFSWRLRNARLHGLALPVQSYTWQSYRGRSTPGKQSKDAGVPEFYDTYPGAKAFLGDILRKQAGMRLPGKTIETDELTRFEHALDTGLYEAITKQEIHLPVFASEFGQATDMCKSVSRDLARGMQELYKGVHNRPDPTRAANILLYGADKLYRDRILGKALADKWLQWSFGVKPLLSDLGALCNILSGNVMDDRGRRLQFSFGRSGYTQSNDQPPPNPSGWWRGVLSFKAKMSGEAMCVATLEEPITRGFQQLGLDDPLGWAWEVIPFSFVVDWFVPVGNWLSSFRSVKGLTFEWGWRYVKARAYTVTKTQLKDFRPSIGQYRDLYKRRVPLTSFPQPTWEGFNANFGVLQAAHAVALVTQAAYSGGR